MRNVLFAGLAAITLAYLPLSSARAAGTADIGVSEYVQRAAQADQFEIRSSQLALTRTRNANVKEFASHMVADHTKSSSRLRQIIGSSGVALTDEKLDGPKTDLLKKLQDTPDTQFDEVYMDMQLEAHQEALALHEDNTDNPNAALAAFAKETARVVRGHLDRAQGVQELVAAR